MRSNLKYCRFCSVAIVWAKSAATGKSVPLDPLSVPLDDRHKPELSYDRMAGHVAHRCKGKGAA
ncbi:hypothetical protein D3C86_1613230 [compost metagenome]